MFPNVRTEKLSELNRMVHEREQYRNIYQHLEPRSKPTLHYHL